MTIDELLQTPYWIIDILPERVPENSPGQYFAVEKYFRQQMSSIKQKHVNVILKLNCYMEIIIDGKVNPEPDQIAKAMYERYVYIMAGDSMILSEPDDTHMTLFNPDERILDLVRRIAAGEGLHVWNGEKPYE